MSSSPPSLDKNKHNCNTPCGYLCVSGEVMENDRKAWAYARVNCKAWKCLKCGPKKAYRLSMAITDWARINNLTRFMTLTLDPKKLSDKDIPEKYISKLWSKLRVYLKRKIGEEIIFIAVKEWHKSGYPHLHVLINKFIAQKWLSSAWSRLGGGKIVHIKKIEDINKTGRYVCKYMTKGMMSGPKGTRRYTTSRGIKLNKHYVHTGQLELFDVKKESSWQLMGKGIEDYYYKLGQNIISEQLDGDGSLEFFITNKEYEDWSDEKSYSVFKGILKRAKKRGILYSRSKEDTKGIR